MDYYDYMERIEMADGLEELNEIVEEASYSMDISNGEYERIYAEALRKAQTWGDV